LAQQPRPGKTATPDDSARRRNRRRWALALALVLVAHALVLLGLVHMPGPLVPLPTENRPALETVVLLPPPKPLPAPISKPVPKPITKPVTRPQPVPHKAPEPEHAEAPPLATAPTGETEMASAGGTAGSGPAAPEAGGETGQAAPSTEPSIRYTPPPSVTLHYASYVNGVRNPDGLISWQQDGSQYRLAVETHILWFRFAFQSTGALGAQGLTPQRYEETRKKRVEAAQFDLAAGTITFIPGNRQIPLPAGAQDRFSVFLQLVGLARGNPQRYTEPGATESFMVADTRDLEPMQVQYVGEDAVDTGQGFVRAKHFVRVSRHAGDRRRVEIWLASSLGWMPVQLRQTEPDGTQIDLIYHGS